MNTPAASLLQQLRDIHPPAPVSWWPLATGWYILLGIIVLFGIIAGHFVWQHSIKLRRRRLALKQLIALRLWFANHTDKQYVASQMSILLKKALLVRYSRLQIAGLHNEKWLLFLDDISHTKQYTQGCGRLLMTAPYASETDDNLEDLFLLIEQTIKRCL